MLRITTRGTPDGPTVVGVEGRLVAGWVAELEETCERLLAARRTIRLDLGAVTYVDRTGVAFLRSLRAREIEVLNGSPFVAELLGGADHR